MFDFNFGNFLQHLEESQAEVLGILQEDLDRMKKQRRARKRRQEMETEAQELQLELERQYQLRQVARDFYSKEGHYEEMLANDLLYRLFHKGYVTREMLNEVYNDFSKERAQRRHKRQREKFHVVK